jgi:IS1 family transposase
LFRDVSTILCSFDRSFKDIGLRRHFGNLFMHRSQLPESKINLTLQIVGLPLDRTQCSPQEQYLQETDCDQQQTENPYAPVRPVLRYRHGGKFADSYGMVCIVGMLLCAISLGWPVGVCFDRGWRPFAYCLLVLAACLGIAACLSGIVGCLPWDWWGCLHDGQDHSENEQRHRINVTQKCLTIYDYCNTVIRMANVLNKDKQIAVIGALAEGSSIRSIERITGIHRDTIMRLGVRAGKGCEMLLDSKMQDLGCRYLQFDEVWGFIGKKERHVSIDDDPTYGDVWTYCAIDAETKLVPTFKCGKRNLTTTTEFVHDVASRMRNRVQISTDALHGYVEAIERSFGADVDYGQIVKIYTHDSAQHPERKYSAPHFASAIRRPITGEPDVDCISTSYIERLNATTRLHVKRLSRLTLAFSKKMENFQAAVALHFAYYNFVRRHNSLRCTPAMSAGVERDFWSVGDLVEATL